VPDSAEPAGSQTSVRSLVSPFVLLAVFWLLNVLVLPTVLDREGLTMAFTVVIAAFFLFLLGKLVGTAARNPARRLPLLLLSGGVTLWAAGSATLNTAGAFSAVTFPSPSEVLFLLSYGGMAAFLLTEVPRRRTLPPLTLWLETTVICGAMACVAAVVVLTPISVSFDRGGVALLLAVLYPLIDLAMATLVLGQMLLHQRDRSLRTGALVLGFVLLAAADSSFVLTLSSHSYVSNINMNLLWGASFGLVVTAACRPPASDSTRDSPDRRGRTLLLAGAVALGVLILSPRHDVGWVFVAVAVVTLLSAGARMAVALREAQGAGEARRLSRTDELTGLPNRRAVLADLDIALRGGEPLSFMLLDLDGFKEINDSVGHTTGDAVLVLIAERLRDALGSQLSVARLGGDEFAMIVSDDDPVTLLETAHSICALMAEPHPIDDLQVSIQASIGVTTRQPDDTGATDLLRRADVAMYEAKSTRSGALLYDPAQDGFTRDRLRRTEELRLGIRDGQLELWYQPQIDAATQQVVAVEALVRWRHPREGLLSPIAFLPDARRYGLMTELSLVVMRGVVADARRWADQGFDFRVSMNCAPPELMGGTFLPQFYPELARAALPPDRLLIEVTEDSFITDPERARERLLDLRAHDVEVAIDDYGTGFSSLSYLRNLPVQELKMDRSFVSTVCTDARSRVIVDTTRQMAHAMGMRVVAEGVEDAATAAALVAMDIDMLQGYHLSAPIPAGIVATWVRQWSRALTNDPASLPEVSDRG
jgi:diguanylate cyclase